MTEQEIISKFVDNLLCKLEEERIATYHKAICKDNIFRRDFAAGQHHEVHKIIQIVKEIQNEN